MVWHSFAQNQLCTLALFVESGLNMMALAENDVTPLNNLLNLKMEDALTLVNISSTTIKPYVELSITMTLNHEEQKILSLFLVYW